MTVQIYTGDQDPENDDRFECSCGAIVWGKEPVECPECGERLVSFETHLKEVAL